MGDEGGPDDRRVVRVVNLIADALALTAEHAGVRYGVYFASLGCLALAAFLFGPGQLAGAAVALTLAFLAVVFVVVFWFFEERRKRRVTLGRERPLKRDALNPDFRDEAIAACLTLFLFVPLTLQTFNKEALHYEIVPGKMGLPEVVCGDGAAAPCGELQRLAQLPHWFLFTVRSFVLTTPVGDVASQSATRDFGVDPTEKTPQSAVDYGLKILFVGFIGSLFGGIYQRVSGQMRDAIKNLRLSHEYAAALGPIMLKPLCDEMESNSGDEVLVANVLRAVTSIAERYPLARSEMVLMFEQTLTNEVAAGIGAVPFNDKNVLLRLEATAEALCSMRSEVGIVAVRERAARSGWPFAEKRKLARVLARTLGEEALPHLVNLASRNPVPGMRNEIARLMKELQPSDGDGDGDGSTVQAALPPPDGKVDKVVGGPLSRNMTLNFVAAESGAAAAPK